MTFLRGDVSQAGDSKESPAFLLKPHPIAPSGRMDRFDVLDTLPALCQANAMALGRV
jgi:hypothetical protein